MIVLSVKANNRRKGFAVRTRRNTYWFPYAKLDRQPTRDDPLVSVEIDSEIGREGFTYRLASGLEDTVHIDDVLHYNKDPRYLRDLLVYQLSVHAQGRVAASGLSTRELVRRLGTSAAQFYRLLDQTNTRKSVDQLLTLLAVLECDVSFEVRARSTPA